MWLGIFLGGFVTVFLMLYRVKGAIIIGILLVSIVSWPRNTDVTFFPKGNAIGDSNFEFFKKVVDFRRLKYVGNVIDYDYKNGKIWFALITFLYVDLMDTTGKPCSYTLQLTANLSWVFKVPCTPWPDSLV